MNLPTNAEPNLPNSTGTVARSRTRYKSNRPSKDPTGFQSPSITQYEQAEPFRDDGRSTHKQEPATKSRGAGSPGQFHAKFGSMSRARVIDVSEVRLGQRRLDRHIQGDTAMPTALNTKARQDDLNPRRRSQPTSNGYGMKSSGPDSPNLTSPMVVEKLSTEFRPPPQYYGSHVPEDLGRIHTADGRSRRDPTHDKQRPSPRFSTPLEERAPKEQRNSKSRVPEESVATIRPSTLPRKGHSHNGIGHASAHQRSKSREALKKTISAPIAIEDPEVTIKPAFDAPVSAVNAGERRVMVKHGQSFISLPVTPSTTPMDIIQATAKQTSLSIDLNATVLLESFKQLGLERPLRRYEHVRDVMNSWDNDTQNPLIIVPSPTGGKDDDLDLKCVPRAQPGDTSAHIYHSQKPGSWGKRWVTLRSDGQVLIAKKNGGETTNICHLSDFDIYIPTNRQLSKKIKPPKKLCFAVKSQQKSNMFLSTVNFVHFFATNDKNLAAAWYKAVQEWRSWYLVSVMGAGQKDTKQLGRGTTYNTERRPSEPQHSRPFSIETNPTLAAASQTLPTRSSSKRPPASFPKKLTKDEHTGSPTTRDPGPSFVQNKSNQQSTPEPFATTGLLGRTYTKRQQAQRERETNPNAGHNFQPGVPTNSGATTFPKRTTSISQRLHSKPLVDLTPQYREPPQHRKGRGIQPDHLASGGLVKVATSPDQAIPIPPASAWQRPIPAQDGMDRSRSTRTSGRNGTRHSSTSPEKAAPAFIGGLLANNIQGQGGQGRGRGLRTGNREATEPMLDLTEGNAYTPGSLLERVERYGPSGPVIEREKKREVDVSVGEGV